MSTVITENKSFEEKMKERIKDSIGDLITDEDLTKMVERSVEESFFKKRTVQSGYNSYEKDPLLHEIVKELLEPQVRLAALEYIHQNKEQVNKVIDKVISEGAGMAVVNAVSSIFSQQLSNLQTGVQHQINSTPGQF